MGEIWGRYGAAVAHLAREGERWRYIGEMWGGMGEIWEGMGRYGEVWGGVGRYRKGIVEIYGRSMGELWEI